MLFEGKKQLSYIIQSFTLQPFSFCKGWLKTTKTKYNMMGVVFTGTVIFKHVIKQLNIKNEVAGCWSEHVEQVLVHRNADKYEVDLTDC